MTNSITPDFQPRLADYIHVVVFLTAFTIVLLLIPQYVEQQTLPTAKLVSPLIGMASLTGVVWLAMVLARNFFILKGVVNAEYYVDYTKSPPPEWAERPARTFNNLLQVPILFYVVCLLSMHVNSLSLTFLVYAWIFVVSRMVHAGIYILVNNVKYRFTAWMTGCITLVFLWAKVTPN